MTNYSADISVPYRRLLTNKRYPKIIKKISKRMLPKKSILVSQNKML